MESQARSDSSDQADEIPFFPNHLLSEIALSFAILGLIVIFSSLFPTRLAEKYDPLNPPQILEPEWYFMGVYQVIKTQGVEPVHAVALLSVLGILLVLVPFIDRGTRRSPKDRPLMMAAAFVVALQFLVLTAYGYATPGQVAAFSDPKFLSLLLIINGISAATLIMAAYRQRRISTRVEALPKHVSIVPMIAFIAVFLIATYAVSQLTVLAPRVLRGAASSPELLIGIGYLAVVALSVLILGRMIYSSEKAAGRVRRRVKMFE